MPNKSIIKKISKLFRGELLIYICILVGYGVLYFLLKDTLPFTPDFSKTDVFHPNVSYKYFLWKAIRSGSIPFWTGLLDGGFPLIAEAQVGMLFLPYYLIFPFFSVFSHAYTFIFSFHLALLTLGMYILLRYIKTPRLLSLLLSVIFTWNGAISFRWVHLIVLQTFSFTPFLYWSYLKWNDSQKLGYLLAVSLILCQMIFTGFIQIVFIAVLGLVMLYVFQNIPLKRNKSIGFFCALSFGIVLALPQILPTLQLSGYTSRTLSNSYDFAVSVPFNVQNLCSFYSARCLGTPQNATYSFNWQKDGIYWENTPYVGELFIILLLILSIFYFKSKQKMVGVYIYLWLFILFTFLALGKNSPLYFIFSIFPFSMFRTPPRFLLFSVFFLILYSSYLFKQFVIKKTLLSFVIYCILFSNCMLLIGTAFSYHLFIDSKTLLSTLHTQKNISNTSAYYTYGYEEEWNAIYKRFGWSTRKSVSDYLFINRGLLPNTSLITGKPMFDIYASLEMRRQLLIKTIIKDGLDIASNRDSTSSQSAQLENLLNLYDISTVISFKPLQFTNFTLSQTMKQNSITLYTYQSKIKSNGNWYYVPKSVDTINNVEDLAKKMSSHLLSQATSLAESIPTLQIENKGSVTVVPVKITDMYLKSTIESENDLFVTIRRNWYPDWKVYIDGKEKKIYKTNLIHMGVMIPRGKHVMELIYIPTWYYIGVGISLFCLGGVVIFWLKFIQWRK